MEISFTILNHHKTYKALIQIYISLLTYKYIYFGFCSIMGHKGIVSKNYWLLFSFLHSSRDVL
jgi:hypothetical protein